MSRNKYSGTSCLTALYEVIRTNVGYGRIFSRQDLLMPIACTSGFSLPEGVSTENLLEDLVKYNYVKSLNETGEKRYLLLRMDERKQPVVGFNPHRK